MMNINDVLENIGFSFDDVLKSSKIDAALLSDIVNGNVDLGECDGETLLDLADITETSIEDLLNLRTVSKRMPEATAEKVHKASGHQIPAFSYTLTCALCDYFMKDADDFVQELVWNHEIEDFYAEGAYIDALYLLGLLDYVCDKNNSPRFPQYEIYREDKLERMIDAMTGSDEALIKCSDLPKAIPQLLRFNIFETPVTMHTPY